MNNIRCSAREVATCVAARSAIGSAADAVCARPSQVAGRELVQAARREWRCVNCSCCEHQQQRLHAVRWADTQRHCVGQCLRVSQRERVSTGSSSVPVCGHKAGELLLSLLRQCRPTTGTRLKQPLRCLLAAGANQCVPYDTGGAMDQRLGFHPRRIKFWIFSPSA